MSKGKTPDLEDRTSTTRYNSVVLYARPLVCCCVSSVSWVIIYKQDQGVDCSVTVPDLWTFLLLVKKGGNIKVYRIICLGLKVFSLNTFGTLSIYLNK